MIDLPIMIFIRSDGFYPVMGVTEKNLAEQAKDHALLNPGTLRVEDMAGNVLWCDSSTSKPI